MKTKNILLMHSKKPPDSSPAEIMCPGNLVENSGNPVQTGVFDYYPFGMQMPDRSYVATTTGYRFGFNNMEKDDELKGTGNSYDFGARLYDPRVGRFLSIDPVYRSFPAESNYIFAGNCPIYYIDYKGKFKWKNSKYAEKYPMVTLYLSKYIENDIKNNQDIINALMEYGNATQKQVEMGAEWGNLPAIDLYSGMMAKGQYSRGFDFFTINEEFVKSLEDKLMNSEFSEIEKQKALIDFFSTVLDEYTHYLENLNSPSEAPSPTFEPVLDSKGNEVWVEDQGTKTQYAVYGGQFNTHNNAGVEYAPCGENVSGCVSLDETIERGKNIPTLPEK